ncbi:MAG: Nif3-like dinuclear metal center hexameric protein [Methylotenera sp.]|nr:Nif3-like dinuclear metal center hexameric protein [Methylotenera sp.]
MVTIEALSHYTQQLMQVERFKDYCPNGLQVEGRQEVRKIVTGVTASMALLEAAQQAGADLILVHHGYFWRNEDPRLVGIKRKRLAFLLKHELNLMSYHLPLDAHPELGNNVQLGNLLGLKANHYDGESNLVAFAQPSQTIILSELACLIEQKLLRLPLVIGNPAQKINTVAWCSGAAQSYFESAIEMGADVFISGEISEQTTHLAQESGVSYISAGHHATERYGVQALGRHLAEKFNIAHEFIEIENQV